MPRKPRLKVYAAAAGFNEAIVAASSQKAALEAWGARENYFAHGIARLVDDPATIKAALAQPGVVLKRPVGSAEDLVAAAKPPASPRKPRPSSANPKSQTKPDRAALDAAEKALKAAEDAAHDLDRAQRKALEAFEQRQAAARETAAAAVAERRKARDAALNAYRKPGG